MLLSPEQYRKLTSNSTISQRKKRKATRHDSSRWPRNIIYYDPIESEGSFVASEVNVIQAAISDWQKYTCLKFQQTADKSRNRVRFVNGRGCSSYVGRVSNMKPQEITLASGCRKKVLASPKIIHSESFSIPPNIHAHRKSYTNCYLMLIQNICRGLLQHFLCNASVCLHY